MKYKPAGIIRRCVAFTLDVLLLVGLTSLTGFILGILSGLVTLPAIGIGCTGAILLMSVPYFIIYESRLGNGQTPGKKAMNLKVLNKSASQTLSPAQSTVRFIGGFINVLTLGFTLVTAFFTPNKQTLADILSGSMVFEIIKNENT